MATWWPSSGMRSSRLLFFVSGDEQRCSRALRVAFVAEQVRVGDIVRLQEDKYIPADLVLLSSSLPHGTAYIQTANLDGSAAWPFPLCSLLLLWEIHFVLTGDAPGKQT